MNRRDFLKLAGLGTGTLFLTPTLVAASWTDAWQAEDAVNFAVAHALSEGAMYADACIGPCVLSGHGIDFAAQGLLETNLLGMRLCTPDGWRKCVIRQFDKTAIEENIARAFAQAAHPKQKRNHWLTAQFCKETVLAQRSSDTTTESHLNMAMLRYGQQIPLPENGPDILFCDILLHQ